MSQENSREKKVEQVFAQNPELDEIFVTSNDFAWRQKSKAESHAATLKDDKVETFERPVTKEVVTEKAAASEKSAILSQGVKKLIVALEGVTDIEVLQALKDEETALGEEARKGAIAAIEARILALSTPAKEVEVVDPVIVPAEGNELVIPAAEGTAAE